MAGSAGLGARAYVGGKEKNKHSKKKLRPGGGGVGKSIVTAVVDRQTNMVDAAVVPDAAPGRQGLSSRRGGVREASLQTGEASA